MPGEKGVPIAAQTALDSFVKDTVPFALDLERELNEQSRRRQAVEKAEAAGARHTTEISETDGWAVDPDALEFSNVGRTQAISITQARSLTDEERLLVRKILACAARMNGRFGKNMLAATLRGSRAKNVSQAER
jgi:hypothetical protein